MALGEIDIFMAAIRRLESGSFAGNYTVAKESLRHDTLGVPLGAYQIMSANWAPWARQAGLEGASWQSKAAQDAVARFKFTQYYNQFGDWRLVAIAWFGGPGAAQRAVAEGLDSISGRSDSLGTSIGKYVDLITGYMHEAQDRGYGPAPRDDVTARLDPQARGSVEGGQLSVDQPLFGDSTVQVQSTLQQGSVPGANPDLTPLQDYTAQQREPRGNQLDADLQKKSMHKNVSSILQGISNSIKAGAQAMQTAAPLTQAERDSLDVTPEDRDGDT